MLHNVIIIIWFYITFDWYRLILWQAKKKSRNSIENLKDVDLRQMLKTKKLPPVFSIADEVANLTRNKVDDESDQDEESDLVIEMPIEDDDKEKAKHAANRQSKYNYLRIFSLF